MQIIFGHTVHPCIWRSACNFDWDIGFSAWNSVGWRLKHPIWWKIFFFVNCWIVPEPQPQPHPSIWRFFSKIL